MCMIFFENCDIFENNIWNWFNDVDFILLIFLLKYILYFKYYLDDKNVYL